MNEQFLDKPPENLRLGEKQHTCSKHFSYFSFSPNVDVGSVVYAKQAEVKHPFLVFY